MIRSRKMDARLNKWEKIFHKVENLLHYKFRNRSILKEALTIRSNTERTYQRLEFLGDTVLKLVLSQVLFDKYPSWGEGQLTKTRSQLEKNKHLRNIAKAMKLNEIVKPEDGKPFHKYEDLVESLIGAVFKDSDRNLETIEKLVREIMDLRTV